MMMSKFTLAAVWNSNRGTTAVEFAMVAPVFIGLIVSIVYLCMGLFLVGSMHYAVEEGARCLSVKACDPSTVVAYTQNHYYGPAISPTFPPPKVAPCGNQVSGSANFVANLGLTTVTIPISATACFPYFP
jgi:TadE-like protein